MKKVLNGKTVLITGSTRQGIGATAALVLAHLGAKIVLNYGTGEKGRNASVRASLLEKKIKKFSKKVITVAADIKKEKDVKKLFKKAVSEFGSVDILVNNAGGTWIPQDFAGISTEHWEQAVRSEIDGTFYCMREALPFMRKKRWGRIINICLDEKIMEIALLAQNNHILEKYPYDFAIAKYAKQRLTSLISPLEFKYGITCNNIMPGIIEEMNNSEALKIIKEDLPPSIHFNPVDVARVIAYLCTKEAAGITGSDIKIPGNIYKRL